MSYSYSKLKGRIVEKYSTQGKFAEALGVSEKTVSCKLTCKSGFSQEDMIRWGELLDITSGDFGKYFFC